MEKTTKTLTGAGIAVAITALVLGGGYYYAQKDGFSGISKNGNSVETYGSFTGSSIATPTKAVGTKGPNKSGFSSGTKDVVTTKSEFTGSSMAVPEKGMEIPTPEEKTPQATPDVKQKTPGKVPTLVPYAVPFQAPTLEPEVKQVVPVIQKTPKLMPVPVATGSAVPTVDKKKALNKIDVELNELSEEVEALEKLEK